MHVIPESSYYYVWSQWMIQYPLCFSAAAAAPAAVSAAPPAAAAAAANN